MGYTEHHVAFGLAHLALLGYWLRSAQNTSRFLRGVIGGFEVCEVACRAILAGACWSPSISAAVHAQLATFPVLRLGLPVHRSLVYIALAAHLVNLKSEGMARAVKLVILFVLSAVNIHLIAWWWVHDLSGSTLQVPSHAALLLNSPSLAFIYSACQP